MRQFAGLLRAADVGEAYMKEEVIGPRYREAS